MILATLAVVVALIYTREVMIPFVLAKDELSSLDELKATPEELKARVSEIIESIETKAEGIELPETVTKALEGIKEKLIALRDYL